MLMRRICYTRPQNSTNSFTAHGQAMLAVKASSSRATITGSNSEIRATLKRDTEKRQEIPQETLLHHG
jgi:hypothetical protein